MRNVSINSTNNISPLSQKNAKAEVLPKRSVRLWVPSGGMRKTGMFDVLKSPDEYKFLL